MMSTLVDASVRACGIALVIGLGLRLWRVKAGETRHAAWTAVLIAMLALPILPNWMPRLILPVPTGAIASTLGTAPTASRQSDRSPSARVATAIVEEQIAPSAQSTRTPASPGQTTPSWPWSQLALGVWFTVTPAFLVRLVTAWRRTGRLGSDARPLNAVPGSVTGTGVFESSRVAAPVTVGVWRPRILLPLDWREWSASTLQAVLVHERAHIARRDPVVALLAEVNICVFWFHPLAWWLRRQIAKAAEQACDDRTLRFVCEPSHYADILIAMATAVQRRGARVSWAGLGMGDSAGLEQRLDRVLRGDGLRQTPALVRLGVFATCVVAIAVGVACRQAPADLRPDPETAAQLLRTVERSRRSRNADALTLEGVAALEQTVTANPDDLDTMETLLYFYRFRAQKMMGWDATLVAKRALQLKLIARHPESDLASFPDLLKQYDPVGYAQARALWMAHVAEPNVSATVLGNAAAFFTPSEKSVAEALLLRAAAIDPSGPTPAVVNGLVHQKWLTRLGVLYAQAIVGANDNTLGNVVKAVSLEEAHGAFANIARARLAASDDAALLSAAGAYLSQNTQGADGKLDFNVVSLGRTYLERALAIAPGDERAQRMLLIQEVRARRNRMRLALPGSVQSLDDARIAALPEHDRFEYLPALAENAYSTAENVEHSDPAEYARLLSRARQWARESLVLAEKFRNDPEYGTAIYKGHVILGTVALRNGDRRTAVNEMQLAATAPPSPTLTAGDTLGHYRLTNYLLRAGERESVADFLEKVSAIWPWEKPQLLEDAQNIRNGVMPRSYQNMFSKPS